MMEEARDRRKLLRLVMLAVFVWGSALALGATLYGYHPTTGDVQYAPNLKRGLIVEGCVLTFLTIWIVALTGRTKSVARQRETDE